MVLQELQDAEDNVVDVAEARRLALLRVVEAAGPVDADVSKNEIFQMKDT